MFVGQKVITPYGVGSVQEIRSNGQLVVVPSNWKLANNQKPTFYMNAASVKPFFGIDENIVCSFGAGVVKDIRDEDGIYVVTLTNWQLANGKSPTLYLNEQSLMRPSSKHDEKKEPGPNSFALVYKDAMAEKDLAKAAYLAKRFEEAKLRYATAVDTMRRIDEEMTNEEKGRFFEMSLTCNSNLGLCCWGLKDYSECILFARNAVTLIDAMESKIGNSELWNAIVETGIMNLEKMKDMKVKALRIIAKSEIERKNFDLAKTALETALRLSPEAKINKELTDLLADTSKKLAAAEKREKSLWQKAFKKGSKGEGDLYTSNQEKVDSIKAVSGSKSPEKAKGTDKNDSKKNEENKDNQLWKADNFFRGPIFGSFLFLGVIGLVGSAAYWWSRRRR